MIRLSEHLMGVSAVELSVDDAAAALEQELRRFGPVQKEPLDGWDDAKRYLLPLKSFPTRYLVLGFGSWSMLIKDMRYQLCDGEAMNISKASKATALSARLADHARHWHFYQPGVPDRHVVCYRDNGRWVFHEQGPPASLERTEFYSNRSKKDRLTPEMVCIYLTTVTGVTFPLRWGVEPFKEIIGLERSTSCLQVPLKLWDTDEDV